MSQIVDYLDAKVTYPLFECDACVVEECHNYTDVADVFMRGS